MSRYSFIDDNINLTGKQCFCIDVNSNNSPFIIEGGNQNVQPQSPRANTQSPAQIVSAPVASELSISGYENKKSDTRSLPSDYLLTPNVINSNAREQNIINKVNSMLTQVYSNVQKDIIGSNEAEIDIPKNSLTLIDDKEVMPKIDLNKMANDKQVGKKTIRKSSGNLNLFEGFEQSGCTDICKPSNKYKNKSKFKFNENFILLAVIVLFLLISWFKK
jgi:hypothetical protein